MDAPSATASARVNANLLLTSQSTASEPTNEAGKLRKKYLEKGDRILCCREII
jgi:hypothetical protein